MILYVNGCSHTYGDEAGGPEFAYGNHIAKNLNYSYVNHAEVGCSNDSIISRTRDYLRVNTPDFIIIGWTSFERETWEYNGRQYHVNSSNPRDHDFPKELLERYKNYVIKSHEPTRQIHKLLKSYCDIYDLHCLLKEKNISHLFFNAFQSFENLKNFKIPLYNWEPNECYIDPYSDSNTYYQWLVNKGFKPYPKFYHHGPEAHKEWSNFLFPKVKRLISST